MPPPDDDNPRPGRPPKLTPAVIDRAVKLALTGAFRGVLARRLGVHPVTFQRWMNLGKRDSDGLDAQLRSQVHLAEAEFECNAVDAIREAGQEDAKFLCWILERKYPKRWGRYRGELGEIKRRLKELERMAGVGEPTDDYLG